MKKKLLSLILLLLAGITKAPAYSFSAVASTENNYFFHQNNFIFSNKILWCLMADSPTQ